jgi:hypothetical protein
MRLLRVSQEKPLERLLSEREAIEMLGLGERRNPQGALRWLMRTRKLAYVRLARGIYGFRRQDLAAFIEAGRVEAAAVARKQGADN